MKCSCANGPRRNLEDFVADTFNLPPEVEIYSIVGKEKTAVTLKVTAGFKQALLDRILARPLETPVWPPRLP